MPFNRHALGVLLLLIPAYLHAQTNPAPGAANSPPDTSVMLDDRSFLKTGWVSVTGPHLSETEYTKTLAMLETGSADMQERALGELETMLREGKTDGSDPNIIKLVSWVCLEPLTVIHANKPDRKYQNPVIRAKAIAIMGLAGGDNIVPVLLLVLETESEPMVLSEAYRTWRKFLRDSPDRLIPLMTRHLSDPFPNKPNTALMLEILATIRETHNTWHSMLDAGLMQALMRLSGNSAYGRTCTAEATKLLKFLLRMPESN